MTHTVAFLAYPGFSLLNLSGPASVFDGANFALRMNGRKPLYEIEVLSHKGGLVVSDGGIAVHTRALARMPAAQVHTALFLGAHMQYLRTLQLDPAMRRWAARCANQATRFGSICTGAFVLAALGMLDGKRVASHWFSCGLLAEQYPTVTVDADALYVVDGKTWTSAGASAGIDMALAMVGRDLGDAMAGEVAKGLVVYARRPGYQSQFSPLLLAQAKADGPFAELTEWLQANLHLPLGVANLAARCGLSERTFHRKFAAATGESPARFIEAVRLDAARTLLSQGLTVKAIAAQVGLTPAARLTRAFERRFGLSPSLFREMHGGANPGAYGTHHPVGSSRRARRG
jgi:transcriptional regulator GlxA family with amidase domain